MVDMLNLKKNDILDLTKIDPSINKLRLCAGWDVAKRGLFGFLEKDFDLDLVALLLDKDGKLLRSKGIIYYGDKKGNGICLHGDNRTGEGDGDDEMISIVLDKIQPNCSKIIFSVTIYNGESKKQNFSKVKNAYVRLLDEDKNDKEICRYNLSGSGGDNTAIIFAELQKEGKDWSFKAVGNLLKGSVKSLVNMYE